MIRNIILSVAFLACCVLLTSCDYKGQENPNLKPELILYNNPSNGDTLGAAPIICWRGFDTDGKVYDYQYISLPKEQPGSTRGIAVSLFEQIKANPQMLDTMRFLTTTGGDTIKWHFTSRTCDTVFLSLLVQNAITEHFFCVRAIDFDIREGQDTIFSPLKCVTLFRSNLPPDSVVIIDSINGEEFWCLDDTVYSWDGINVRWRGHDPDRSIILEYYWWLENTATGARPVTSLIEDSLGGVHSGMNPYDGWIRSTSAKIRGPVPTGTYRFIIKVRDDAFYEGAADTATIFIAHPYFDISREWVREAYALGTYDSHNVLLIDQNNAILYPSVATVRNFYVQRLERMRTEGVIARWDTITSTASTLSASKTLLSHYNILYVLDQEPLTTNKMSSSFLKELMDYVKIGGRIIMDGREIFFNEDPDWTETPSYHYFGIAEENTGSNNNIFNMAKGNANIPGYRTLRVDSTKTFGSAKAINKVNRVGARPPSYYGSPYVQVLYRFGITNTATQQESLNFNNVPVALRFVTPSFRTAYFAFPLYLMNDDSSQVYEAMKSTMEFIKSQVIPAQNP